MIPFVTIKLDTERKIRMGMGAMCEFESITKKKLMDLEEEMSMTTITELLWVMLKQEDKTLTLEQTQKLIDDNADNMNDVMDSVTAAVQAAFGNSKNGKRPAAK